MSLNNDLEMFGRRLNNLESPQNYIRIGTFLGYEEGTEHTIDTITVDTDRVELNIPVGDVSPKEHSHTVSFGLFQSKPPSGVFLRGTVAWAEENLTKEGTAIMASPRTVVAIGGIIIPASIIPGNQVLLIFVSGLIFALPFVDTFD